MAGVLRYAAGRLRVVVTTVSRPSLFPSGARASILPRLVHTEVGPSSELPPWFRDYVRGLVKESVQTEMKEIRGLCFDRYEHVCTRLIAAEEVGATRHAEAMVTYIKAEQRFSNMCTKVGVTMISLAAASECLHVLEYRARASSPPPPPPSHEEVAAMVHKEVAAMVHKDVAAMDHKEVAAMDHKEVAAMVHKEVAAMDQKDVAAMVHKEVAAMDQKDVAAMVHKKKLE